MNIRNFILSWEGGFCNIDGDAGGITNSGVTLATYQSFFGKDKTAEDLRKLTKEEWEYIFKKGFWDRMMCDYIKDENVRNFLVDWGWNSGTKTAAKAIQRIVGVKDDGVIGSVSVNAINKYNPTLLFYRLFNARQNYLEQIVKNKPSQQKFILG